MREREEERKAADERSSLPPVEVSMSEAQDGLGEVVSRVRHTGQRAVLVRYGKHVAAIVPIADLKRLQMTA